VSTCPSSAAPRCRRARWLAGAAVSPALLGLLAASAKLGVLLNLLFPDMIPLARLHLRMPSGAAIVQNADLELFGALLRIVQHTFSAGLAPLQS
jgi:hypothetical protein